MEPGSVDLSLEEPQIGALAASFFGSSHSEHVTNSMIGDEFSLISHVSGERSSTPVVVTDSESVMVDSNDPNLCPSIDGFLQGLEVDCLDHEVVSSCHMGSSDYEPSFSGLVEPPAKLADDYDADRVVDSAWKNLQSNSLKHF